jgi:putative tryptophan/tyrosine transport system substrate-binding protein
MLRREFIAGLGTAIAWPSVAHSQSKKIPVIGLLLLGDVKSNVFVPSLQEGLRDLGWIENHNVTIEARYAPTVQQLPETAAELVRLKVDVIFASSSIYVEAARRATRTIPIVFGAHADPVGVGHVASLAHPGGNITGQSQLLTELASKQLAILNEAVPKAQRIGVLWDPLTPSHLSALKAIEVTAEKLHVRLVAEPARSADDYDAAISAMTNANAETLLVMQSTLSIQKKELLAALALKERLPTMFGVRENVIVGGLMSYGANVRDLYRQAATQIDKILKGANPADLPVEQATKFEFAINLKTARLLGLEIPPTLLARADDVIE